MRSSGYVEGSSSTTSAPNNSWFGTGDVGQWTGGILRVIDRRTNVIKLSQGEFVELGKLELLFSRARHIHRIFIYADSFKASVVAIVLPSLECTCMTTEQVNSLVMSEIQEIARTANLRAFEIPCAAFVDRNSEWTASNGCLTEANKVLRRGIISKYKSHIDSLYVRAAVSKELTKLSQTLSIDSTGLTFSQLGGDSLSAVRVLNSLRAQAIQVSYDDLIRNPFGHVSAVSDDLSVMLHADYVTLESEEKKMQELIVREIPSTQAQPNTEIANILLTGCTGFLGTHLLAALLSCYPTAKIYCLTRDVQKLPTLHDRLIPICGDLSKQLLGLSEEVFDSLCKNIDIVFHNGCNVNHLLPYEELYNTNVRPIFDIVRLAVRHHLKPVSHISSVSFYSRQHTRKNGYGTSKVHLECSFFLTSVVGCR